MVETSFLFSFFLLAFFGVNFFNNLFDNSSSRSKESLFAMGFNTLDRSILGAFFKHSSCNRANNFILFDKKSSGNVSSQLGNAEDHFVIGRLVDKDCVIRSLFDFTLGPFLHKSWNTFAPPAFLFWVAAFRTASLLFFP